MREIVGSDSYASHNADNSSMVEHYLYQDRDLWFESLNRSKYKRRVAVEAGNAVR